MNVKLTAKPNTWFKAGTEVFHYDQYSKRITLEEYNDWVKSGVILVRGIRVCETGEETEDGELCSLDEFDVEIQGERND